MSSPIYQGLSSGYFSCDRDPTSSEPEVNAIPFPSTWLTLWWNQTSENLFYCNDPTQSTLVWHEIVNPSNISSIISSNGWNLNKARSYSQISSPAFNTSYTPSATNDFMVNCIVNVTSTLVTPGTVLFQINDGSGYVTRGEASVSGIAASIFQTITCLVPANSSYQLLNSSGTATIVSLNELTM